VNDENLHLLESYLADLQSGRMPERDALLDKAPDLVGAFDCLDLLEKMAPSPSGERRDVSPPVPPTVAVTSRPGEGSAAPAADSRPDFGKYEVECELGRGGMGVVFKAKQKDLERPVALKMILSSHLASADHISRFQDEAKAAASLHHPNIVSVYEAGQLNGQPFFAMQYVAGPSLAQRLRESPMAQEDAARIVESVARAVGHLHEHHIIHRDLKPSNILLDQAGNPYVTDFGLVKMLAGDSHRTSTGVIVGTPSYMSPEQASGQAGKVGPLSDVYSLGAILYELLTGRPPFLEATPLDTLVQVLEGEPLLPRRLRPSVAPELEMICLRCLEKNPAERYPSAAVLADDLARFLKNEEIEVRRPGLYNRLRRWVRREPALASRLVTLGICLVLAQISYQAFPGVPLRLHLSVVGILAVWAALSVACQLFLVRERWANPVRFLWAALDVVLFSAVIYVDEALVSPILIGYPLLVAASGLWFRVPLIWFTAAIAELSYAGLLLDSILRKAEAGGAQAAIEGLHKHLMFMVGLAVTAFVVSYQVNRVRALSRYYEHRPLP
jgi:serine/threonine protein kinase